MRTETPLLLEPDSAPPVEAPPAPPVIPPGARLIRGRVIQRGRGGWYEAVPQPPRLVEVSGPYGKSESRYEPVADQIVWQAPDPVAEVEALGQEQPGWRELDPRPTDKLWNALERAARDPDYDILVAKYVKDEGIAPRIPLKGIPLGQCFRSFGTVKVNLNDDALRELLKLHANGQWGLNGKLADVVLDDDMKWCPAIFSVAVCNAVAVERGVGAVCSVYPRTFGQTRGVERVKVATLINQGTYIYIPSRDAMS